MLYKKPDVPSKPIPVPGELVLKLTAAAQSELRKSIPAGPIRLLAGKAPVAFGISALDKALARFDLSSVVRVHGPLPKRKSAKPGGKDLEKLRSELDRTYRLRFAGDKIDLNKVAKALDKIKVVQSVAMNHLSFAFAVPNDPLYAQQWGLTRIECEAGWDRETGKSSVVIAIADSGVDLNHPDLVDNLVPGRDLVDRVDRIAGDVINVDGELWMVEGDVLTIDDDPSDDVGHGTHVAGTAGAASNNETGVAGVAWGCSLMPIRVLHRFRRLSDNFVSGTGSNADVAAGVRWAADNGADVINLSLGGPADDFVLADAIAYAVASDLVVVAAMGNDDSSDLQYPAAYPGVIAVGATNNTDGRAWFSNFGNHISVVAPGVNIVSTDWDDVYSGKSGTSMAAPHVAGLAGLLLSCSPGMTNERVRTIIEETATPLRDNPADPVPNERYGHGLINVRAALERCILLDLGGKNWAKDIKDFSKEGFKEIKEWKEIPKELKEFPKEGKEGFKEIPKEGKEGFKEVPKEGKEFPKEFKEFKEFPKEGLKEGGGKEFKEGGKEFKEGPKEQIEIPDIPGRFGQPGTPIDPRFGVAQPPVDMRNILDRLQGIEKMLGTGRAFIAGNERPDVGDKISKS